MKAYIEKYGVKHTIETDSDDDDVYEFTRNIYNGLQKCRITEKKFSI